MTQEQKDLILNYIFNVCSENPELLPKIIDAATLGVKEFASKQSDKTSKMAFVMSAILSEHKNKQFGTFSRKEILDIMEPLHGTQWYKEEMAKLG